MVLTANMGSQQMTAREKDIYGTYSEDLERLTFNSKPIINSMTELANDYSSDFAHVIVRCIEDKIKIVSSSQKLPILYLLDSILKNHTRPYQELLQQNIVTVFTHVFQNVPRDQAEKSRTALYKLRLTWNEAYFSATKMNQLDKKIQTLDPNWPIVPTKRGISVERNARTDLEAKGERTIRLPGPSIHINPAVFGRQQSTNNENDLEEQLRKKELELMELKMKKEELELETMRKQISEGRDVQGNDERQQKAVKRPFQSTSPLQVCIISNQSIFLSLRSRRQYLSRSIFINTTIKGHTLLYYFHKNQFIRIFSTYVENIQEILKRSFKISLEYYRRLGKMKLHAKET